MKEKVEELKKQFNEKFCVNGITQGYTDDAIFRWIAENFVPVEAIVMPKIADICNYLDKIERHKISKDWVIPSIEFYSDGSGSIYNGIEQTYEGKPEHKSFESWKELNEILSNFTE